MRDYADVLALVVLGLSGSMSVHPLRIGIFLRLRELSYACRVGGLCPINANDCADRLPSVAEFTYAGMADRRTYNVLI